MLADPSGDREEVIDVELFQNFLVSVIAGVVSYYICKWLDGNGHSDK